ncbi:low-affinity Fe(2+) transport protein [Acrasis kona]|uniref:Low-affinity Fe(2+) transport protein n=1 Tax=Acrasis kona TaxID=1008807 RepID=A0AAW2Z0K7_9EUKA
MKQLHKLSPVFDVAMAKVSHSPGMRSPVSSLGRFAYDYEPKLSSTSCYTAEEPQMLNTTSANHEKHRRALSGLQTKTIKSKNVSRTAPTPDLQKLSPTRSRALFAFGDTYEYKYDGWKRGVQHWKETEAEEPARPATTQNAPIITPKGILSGKTSTMFFQQQVKHSSLAPHLSQHEKVV